jgi:hypothetical protein
MNLNDIVGEWTSNDDRPRAYFTCANKTTKGIEIRENIIIDDNDETVTCRIDGKQYKRIYGRVLKDFGLTSADLEESFTIGEIVSKPNAKLKEENDFFSHEWDWWWKLNALVTYKHRSNGTL